MTVSGDQAADFDKLLASLRLLCDGKSPEFMAGVIDEYLRTSDSRFVLLDKHTLSSRLGLMEFELGNVTQVLGGRGNASMSIAERIHSIERHVTNALSTVTLFRHELVIPTPPVRVAP